MINFSFSDFLVLKEDSKQDFKLNRVIKKWNPILEAVVNEGRETCTLSSRRTGQEAASAKQCQYNVGWVSGS